MSSPAPVEPPSLTAFLNGRLTGQFELDEFGYDRELTSLRSSFARWRWSIDVDGADLIPNGPALVAFSSRLGISEPCVLAAAFHGLDRELRPVGVTDRQPLASALATSSATRSA